MAVCLHLLLVFLLVWVNSLAKPPVFKKHHDPGTISNISKNDPGLQKAVLTGTYTFNNRSNDIFLFKKSNIDAAQRQVVKGIRYVLDVEITRTVCRKMDREVDLAKCHFQPVGVLDQTVFCHFEVWSIPWLQEMKTTYFKCHPFK